jgi:hypothetical protein
MYQLRLQEHLQYHTNGVGIITKHGHAKHTECHLNQDIVVLITAENVVTGQYLRGHLMQFLKCGAVVHQVKDHVVVCKDTRQTQEVMHLKVLT